MERKKSVREVSKMKEEPDERIALLNLLMPYLI